MVTLKDDEVVVTKFKFLALKHSFTCREVVARKLNLLTTEDGCHLLVEEFHIHSPYTLKVVVAVLVKRSINTVDKVVVCRDDMWTKSTCHKEYGKTLTHGCLTATAWTCHEDNL